MKFTELKQLSFELLEESFRSKTEAFTPPIMEAIFGIRPMIEEEVPLLSIERCQELYINKISVIAFVQETSRNLIEYLNNKFSTGEIIISRGYDNFQEMEWVDKLPREGLCLVSIGCIPNSKNKNFWNQTLALADFVQQVIPEIQATSFWRKCTKELRDSKVKIERLLIEEKNMEASAALEKLLINRHFRLSASEAFQQIVAYEYCCKKKLLNGESSLTQEIVSFGDVMTDTGYFDHGFMSVFSTTPHHYYEKVGCSFVCNLNWLKSLS